MILVLSLQITGPRQSPRIDEPHPASIARTRLVVAWCTGKKIVQMMQNCPCVTHWHNRKLSQDILYGNDIKNWLSVIKLIYNLGTN
jgi:hypothetical protein